MVVYRLDDRLFFANARYVKGRIREAIHGAADTVEWLVFDAEAVTHVDASGLDMLADLRQRLADEGVEFAVARLHTSPKRHFDECGLTAAIGPERFYPTVHGAVRACTV